MRYHLAIALSFLCLACSDDALPQGGSPQGGGTPTAGNDSGAGGPAGAGAQGGSSDGGSSNGGSNEGGSTSDGGSNEGGKAPTCTGKTLGAGDTEFTMMFGGEDREFRVHAPPAYDPEVATPVVLVLHGYLESNDDIENITQMTPEADDRGYIVVYPQGRSTSWNAGSCCGSSQQLGVDDVGFINAMLDQIESDYCVDVKRVYSSGFSNGGMLSHRLACEAADRIAAIGPVSGTMALPTCTPSRPVPVQQFHGTSDFVVPYNGGVFGPASVPVTTADWVERNGCDATPTVTFDMGDATCETYSNCMAAADVVLCTLDGGGHQWPGGESAGPGGTINMDIFASEALLDFFDAHPMP
jgi:polyhydroxybutyrate depolymerase